MPSKRKYNFIFEKLVGAPDDVVGLISYGIYKGRKVEFIQSFTEANGQHPDEEQLSNFHIASVANVQGYRTEATEIIRLFLKEYLENDIAEHRAELESEFEESKARLQNDYDSKLERLKPSALANITHSVIGSLLFTTVIGVVLVFILGVRIGVGGLLEEFTRMLAPLKIPPA